MSTTNDKTREKGTRRKTESRAWYAISGYDAARELAVDLAHGLTAEEVAQRREQSGWNTLTEAPPVPRWKNLSVSSKNW